MRGYTSKHAPMLLFHSTYVSLLAAIATIIPSILFLVFVHPAPAEDCPCFEDAVAFLSVVIGLLVGKNLFPADFTGHTYGGGGEQWTTFGGLAVWVGAIVAKLALGES